MKHIANILFYGFLLMLNGIGLLLCAILSTPWFCFVFNLLCALACIVMLNYHLAKAIKEGK